MVMFLICSVLLNTISVSGSVSGISDHELIECMFHIATPPSLEEISLAYHGIRSVNSNLFAASVQFPSLPDLHALSPPVPFVVTLCLFPQ